MSIEIGDQWLYKKEEMIFTFVVVGNDTDIDLMTMEETEIIHIKPKYCFEFSAVLGSKDKWFNTEKQLPIKDITENEFMFSQKTDTFKKYLEEYPEAFI